MPALNRFDAASAVQPTGPIDDFRVAAYRERHYPPSKLALIVQVLAESGVPAIQALRGTGLTPVDLDDARTRVSMQQIMQGLFNLAALDARADAGLRLGLRVRASTYGMYGYALLCSSTLRSAFDTGVRFQRLGGGLVQDVWLQDGDRAVWFPLGEDEQRFVAIGARPYEVLRDFHVGIVVRLAKDIMGDWCRPALARFVGAPPIHAQALALALECPLEFDQPRNELHYPAAWLDRPPQLANPITAAEVSQACARLLEQLDWQAGFTRRVYQELTAVPGRFPDIEAVASRLCMTSRTLRRRLEAEGTSFRQLLDEVRHALAKDYLRSALSVEDVTSALGFGNAATFRRAYRRWTGDSPSRGRSQT